jgi:hypothetical protein
MTQSMIKHEIPLSSTYSCTKPPPTYSCTNIWFQAVVNVIEKYQERKAPSGIRELSFVLLKELDFGSGESWFEASVEDATLDRQSCCLVLNQLCT